MNNYFDWSDLAFASKQPINELSATLILAPREMSTARLTQLVKHYLPSGNIIIGIAKEAYVEGFDGQAQFRMLAAADVQAVIRKVAASASPYKMYWLQYHQRETGYILEKTKLRHVVLVNGSWSRAFHTRSEYYTLANRSIPYSMVSPFASESEAKIYAESHDDTIRETLNLPAPRSQKLCSTSDMLSYASEAAKLSYDYSFQTGATLGKNNGGSDDRYTFLVYAYNKVVPYQTYAMHHGAARERNFSPPQDLNHYDTVHAEVEMLITALQKRIDLADTTLFINLMPCPTCARMLTETSIKEIVYQEDHSQGYAVQILEQAGKLVRRQVAPPS